MDWLVRVLGSMRVQAEYDLAESFLSMEHPTVEDRLTLYLKQHTLWDMHGYNIKPIYLCRAALVGSGLFNLDDENKARVAGFDTHNLGSDEVTGMLREKHG